MKQKKHSTNDETSLELLIENNKLLRIELEQKCTQVDRLKQRIKQYGIIQTQIEQIEKQLLHIQNELSQLLFKESQLRNDRSHNQFTSQTPPINNNSTDQIFSSIHNENRSFNKIDDMQSISGNDSISFLLLQQVEETKRKLAETQKKLDQEKIALNSHHTERTSVSSKLNQNPQYINAKQFIDSFKNSNK